MTTPRVSMGMLLSRSIVGGGLLAGLLGGCVVREPSGPLVLGPGGGVAGVPPPGAAPGPIDLTAEGAVARTSVAPTTIDTRDFETQISVRGAFEGKIRSTGADRPRKTDRPVVPAGAPNDLPVGGMLGESRGDPGAFFPGLVQTPWSPPDPSIAVGPTHVVETVNMAIAFFSKDGELEFSQNLDSTGSPGFFEEVGGGTFTFDPKCFYDPHAERFVVVALEVYGDFEEAWIDIAVSDDSDPHGVWHKYRTWAVIQVGNTTYWVDYPGFGYDQDAFYVTGNLFRLSGPGGGFAGAVYRAFDKTPLLAGEPATFADIRKGSSASVQVPQTFGEPDRTYFVSRDSGSALKIETMNDPLGDPSISATSVSVPPHSGPDQDAPNLGGGEIDTLDGRIMNVTWRDGKLHAGHGIDAGSRTLSRWYEIDLNGWPAGGSPTLAQSGNVDPGAGVHTFFPALAPDAFGNVAMVTAMSSSSTFASVQALGRLAGDPPGSMGDLVELETGSATANGRWGDYFDIAVDPTDDTTFWMVGEYASDIGWETWIGTFTLACGADFNGDGSLDVLDFVAFQEAFVAGEASADCDADGVLNVLDFVCFQVSFQAGCP